MSKDKKNFKFIDKDGISLSVSIYWPGEDVEEYGSFELGDASTQHVVVAFDEKPDFDDSFERSERPTILRGKDENGRKVYLAFAGADDISDLRVEGAGDEIIEISAGGGRSGGSDVSGKASRLAEKLNRKLGGGSSGGAGGSRSGGGKSGGKGGSYDGRGKGQKCTKDMLGAAASAAGMSTAAYAAYMGYEIVTEEEYEIYMESEEYEEFELVDDSDIDWDEIDEDDIDFDDEDE